MIDCTRSRRHWRQNLIGERRDLTQNTPETQVLGGAFWCSFFCYLSLDLDLDDLAFLFLPPFFFPPFPAMTRGTSNLKPRRITYPKGVFLPTGRPPRAVQREGGRKESERREREERDTETALKKDEQLSLYLSLFSSLSLFFLPLFACGIRTAPPPC